MYRDRIWVFYKYVNISGVSRYPMSRFKPDFTNKLK